ncbi:hypothetical protein [Marinobacter fonticola]|uniref:hypothetical protein n=1 Tax=Marinobacter fonticola TaxID=2603215 RepID=UPI0011E7E157|nr:hypothetical protein [Marinobacter fonticola]
MDVLRSTPYGLSTLDRKKAQSPRRTRKAPETPATPTKRVMDRRVRPDRRRRQEPFDGEDRRKRSTRRSPSLLHPRNARPIAAEDRRGERLDTSA